MDHAGERIVSHWTTTMAPPGVTPEAPVQSEHAIDEGRATAMMTAVRRLMRMTGTAQQPTLTCAR